MFHLFHIFFVFYLFTFAFFQCQLSRCSNCLFFLLEIKKILPVHSTIVKNLKTFKLLDNLSHQRLKMLPAFVEKYKWNVSDKVYFHQNFGFQEMQKNINSLSWKDH